MPNPPRKILRHLWHRFVLSPLGYGKPVPASALDNEYRTGHWDHFFGPNELARHETLVRLINDRAERFSLLDLGCGSGRLASMLDPRRLTDYLGVDLSTEGLARARALQLPHGRFLQGNFEEWRPSTPYDIITFNECIGYAVNPAHTAGAFARWLNPGGCIIISHYRWGNHAAVWRALAREFAFAVETSASNDQGQVWDLKVLVPRDVR